MIHVSGPVYFQQHDFYLFNMWVKHKRLLHASGYYCFVSIFGIPDSDYPMRRWQAMLIYHLSLREDSFCSFQKARKAKFIEHYISNFCLFISKKKFKVSSYYFYISSTVAAHHFAPSPAITTTSGQTQYFHTQSYCNRFKTNLLINYIHSMRGSYTSQNL